MPPLRLTRTLILSVVAFTLILYSSYAYFFHLPPPPPSALRLDPERVRLARLDRSQLSGYKPKHAFATFLSSDTSPSADANNDDSDMYFVATKILAYQLLHDSRTRTPTDLNMPFVVLTTTEVSERKKDKLRRMGAHVMTVPDIVTPWWVKTGVTRWKDQFTKLRLFELIEFDLVCFIDADTLLTAPLHGVFSDPAVISPAETLFNRTSEMRSDEAPLPKSYLFASRPDNQFLGESLHPVPPTSDHHSFSAGFYLARPDWALFDYYMSVMQKWGRFDSHTMEQSLLNYAHLDVGPMPWRRTDWKWSATWPGEADVHGGVVGLHEKLWRVGPAVLRGMWEEKRREMVEYEKGLKA